MIKKLILTLVAITICVPVVAGDAEPKRLDGTFYLRGESITDPSPGEPQNTHMAFHLEGAAAHQLYDSMNVAAAPDQCLGSGTITKAIGEMQCMKSAKKYQCDFAIDIKSQKIVAGATC